MIKPTAWLVGLLLCISCSPTAPKQWHAYELQALGKEAIIDIAEKEIQQDHPEFSKENFDHIKVLTDDVSVSVSFVMPIRYVPRNSTAYYGVLYGLAEPGGPISSWDRQSNPKNSYTHDLYKEDDTRFFQPTDESTEAIALVLKALELQAEDVHWEESVTIYEQETTYDVTFNSPTTISNHTVTKGTGEVVNHGHSHWLPMPGKTKAGWKRSTTPREGRRTKFAVP